MARWLMYEEREDIAKLIETTSLPLRVIADRKGISRDTVHKIMKEFNVHRLKHAKVEPWLPEPYRSIKKL